MNRDGAGYCAKESDDLSFTLMVMSILGKYKYRVRALSESAVMMQ